jgi:hypothetical protein
MLPPLAELVNTGTGVGAGGLFVAFGGIIGVILYHLLPFLLKRAELMAQHRKDLTAEEAAREVREQALKAGAWEDAKTAYEKWLMDQEQQNTRLQGVVDRQQQAIDAIQSRYADCLQTRAQQTGTIHFLHAGLRRAFAELKGLGRDPGELPDLPAPADPGEAARAEFNVRQVAQHTSLVRELGEHIDAARPGPAREDTGGGE